LRTPLAGEIVDSAVVNDPVSSIGELLLRQARRRRAPEWALQALAGEPGRADIREEGATRLVLTGEDGSTVELEVRLHVPPLPVAARRPWRPPGLDVSDEELATLSYLVVDEIVEDAVDVSVSPWPGVDDRGRLVFADEPARSAQASPSALLRYLRRVDFRPGPAPAALRMGDAFAARVRPGRLEAAERAVLAPSAWLVPPVYGIGSAARQKAKEAFFAAVAPTLSEAEAEQLRKMEPRA
jgi:hypothetical protein